MLPQYNFSTCSKRDNGDMSTLVKDETNITISPKTIKIESIKKNTAKTREMTRAGNDIVHKAIKLIYIHLYLH
jgi:hypothetical protein